MRFDKFTVKAQEAVVRGQELAQRRNNAEILPLHILASLVQEEEGVVGPLLQNSQRRGRKKPPSGEEKKISASLTLLINVFF